MKVLIVAVSFYYLYRQLFVKNDFYTIVSIFRKIWAEQQHLMLISIVLLLTPVNWGIEAFKWKWMISRLEKISMAEAVEAVLSGTTFSFFTPNRVGEFAGRIFLLRTAERIPAALISILGSVAQLLATILFGGIALLFFVRMFFAWSNLWYVSFAIVDGVALMVLLYLFLNTNRLNKIASWFHVPSKWLHFTTMVDLFKRSELKLVVLLSVLRYMVFMTQFVILLFVMGVNAPLLPMFMMVALTYLVLAIPFLSLNEFGMRSVVAVQLIGNLSGNHAGILAASLTIYVINVALAALLGTVFVFRIRFFRTENNTQ